MSNKSLGIASHSNAIEDRHSALLVARGEFAVKGVRHDSV